MREERPTIDRRLRSISVPRQLMPSLLAIKTGMTPRRDAAVALAMGGLLKSGSLDPLVGDLLDAMTEPELVVSIEVEADSGPRLTTIWRCGRLAVAGTSDVHRQFHITQLEPVLLPFHLAQAVGVQPVGQPDFSGSFAVPYPAYVAAKDLTRHHPDEAAAELVTAGVEPAWADLLVGAFLMRRAQWMIESISVAKGRDAASLAVLDAGHAGCWRLAPATGTQLEIRPLGFEDVMDLLAALVR